MTGDVAVRERVVPHRLRQPRRGQDAGPPRKVVLPRVPRRARRRPEWQPGAANRLCAGQEGQMMIWQGMWLTGADVGLFRLLVLTHRSG